jgi:hypothetical protein
VDLNLKHAGGKGWKQVFRVNSYHVPINDEALQAISTRISSSPSLDTPTHVQIGWWFGIHFLKFRTIACRVWLGSTNICDSPGDQCADRPSFRQRGLEPEARWGGLVVRHPFLKVPHHRLQGLVVDRDVVRVDPKHLL